MVNTLRVKLTAGSVLKMLTLVALISGLFYAMVIYTIGLNRDQALREKMAIEFNLLGLQLPAELSLPNDTTSAGQEWQIIDHIKDYVGPYESYDNDDATSFIAPIAPLGAQAQPLLNQPDIQSVHPDTLLLDGTAVQAASKNGSDLRTIFTENGTHMRLLTYRLPPGAPKAYMQVGKLLAGEDRIKHRLLLILFGGSVLFTVVAGWFSWKMTGQSLRATWQGWERQQAFVANASHELRTPLTLIRASAQIVQQSLAPNNPQWLLMSDVLSETDHMAKLVDDLLLLSRLDAGALKLDPQVIQMSELLHRLQRQFASLANEREVSVRVNRAEGWVKADPTRLWQVLLILVDNALRHTPAQGSVTLNAEIHGQTHNQTHNQTLAEVVKISVADTGYGIATGDMPHVFERFYKAHTSLADRRSAGLGLSIAKPLIEMHGGTIEIDSQVSQGTRIIITLPGQPAPQPIEMSSVIETL
jgi:signal transduction histidine kinase